MNAGSKVNASPAAAMRPRARDDAKSSMEKRTIVAKPTERTGAVDSSRIPGPLEHATFVTGATSAAQLPNEGAREIAFAGRSNAGKSSAINALARQHRLAFASRTPGRTREVNFFRLRGGDLVADLPGYGYAAVPEALKRSWQDFLWSYVTTRSPLIGLVLIVDARHGLKPLDFDLLDAFIPSGRPVLVLATKIDKLNVAEGRSAVAHVAAGMRERFGDVGERFAVVGFSATTKRGLADADAILRRWLGS
jgi:GTP-binding protein